MLRGIEDEDDCLVTECWLWTGSGSSTIIVDQTITRPRTGKRVT